MGSIGVCCCDECCVTLPELPEIVVAGQTISPTTPGDWIQVSECCFKTRVVALSGPWNEEKSDLIRFDERNSEVYHDVYTNANKKTTIPGSYGVYPAQQVQDAIDAGLITTCAADPQLCATFHELIERRYDEFLLARWRRKSIETYLFRAVAQVVGVDESPICRWFVVSKLTVEYQSGQFNATNEHHVKDATTSGCCSAVGLVSHDLDPYTDAELYAQLAELTPSEFSVYSAKTYLTLPVGTQVFNPGTTLNATFAATPCFSVTIATTQGTVASTGSPGLFPWSNPVVATIQPSAATCQIKVTWADSDGCRLTTLPIPTLIREYDSVLEGPNLLGTHTLQLYAVFQGTLLPPAYIEVPVTCKETCFPSSDWYSHSIVKSKIRDLTFSHDFQDYISRTINISPGSWSILF